MNPRDRDRANTAADHIATQLATSPNGPRADGLSQSLAKGAPGIALLHIERARAGLADWRTAHAWLSAATRSPLHAGLDASLFVGLPAVAFAVHTAAEESGRYERALAVLHSAVEVITRRRLHQARQRIDRGDPPAFTEFDLFYGLTGLGAYHLRFDPAGQAVREVLTYLVRLTEPVRFDGGWIPGWWTDRTPTGRHDTDFPGGHANFGLAHGICGPLALLSHALRHGVTVDGQREAIATICTWLDRWRQDRPTGPWWPQWITLGEVLTGRVRQPGPLRPSWCYGTPGIARAQQLAGLATADQTRRLMAEHALAGCLTDPRQLDQLGDHGLCHGTAGVFQTVWRTAADATDSTLAAHLPGLTDRLLGPPAADADPGLLDGATGHALALHTAATVAAPASGWDACLLLS